jgi:nitrate/nitrite-specific signal transduction histidine kinase
LDDDDDEEEEMEVFRAASLGELPIIMEGREDEAEAEESAGSLAAIEDLLGRAAAEKQGSKQEDPSDRRHKHDTNGKERMGARERDDDDHHHQQQQQHRWKNCFRPRRNQRRREENEPAL